MITKEEAAEIAAQAVPQGDKPDTAPVLICRVIDVSKTFRTDVINPKPSQPVLLTWGELKKILGAI